MYLVDLPGYGYAKVSKDQKASWGAMIETYLNKRQQLKMMVLLVDIRHSPTADDKTMYRWIAERGFPHLVAATKADKISRGQVPVRLKEIRSVLNLTAGVSVIACSSETRQGREEVWKVIRSVLEQETEGAANDGTSARVEVNDGTSTEAGLDTGTPVVAGPDTGTPAEAGSDTVTPVEAGLNTGSEA